MRIELGHVYRDVITGAQGVAIGFVTYITGCNQVLITPKLDKEGKPPDSLWFDEARLEQISQDPIQLPGLLPATSPSERRASIGFDKAPPVGRRPV